MAFKAGHIPWNKNKKRPEMCRENNPAKRLEVREKIRKSKLGDNNSSKRIEVRLKISQSQIGRISPMKGKHHTEEAKQKNREKHLGKTAWNKGVPWNEEIKIKLVKSHQGKHQSKETIQKRREKISGENAPNWQGGISFLPYCPRFNKQKKEEIRNLYDRKCFICGREEKDNITKTNKVLKLDVHHIDEDKEQGCNGKQWKLIPLCRSCHSKLHNRPDIKS